MTIFSCEYASLFWYPCKVLNAIGVAYDEGFDSVPINGFARDGTKVDTPWPLHVRQQLVIPSLAAHGSHSRV
jgi:hypothetical protein